MRRATRAPCLAALGLTTLLVVGCVDEGGFARAKKMESWEDRIGGPAALAFPGRDFLLENDKIRAAIQGVGQTQYEDYRNGDERNTASYSVGPSFYGGSLLDLDLQRGGLQHRAGQGADAIAEIAPMANLLTVGPFYDRDYVLNHPEFDPTFPYREMLCDTQHPDFPDCAMTVAVLTDEELREADYLKDGELCAAVRAFGDGASMMKVLDILADPMKFGIPIPAIIPPIRMQHDYVLCPGESYVRMITEITRPSGTGDDEDWSTMKPFTGPVSLFDTLIAGMDVDGANILAGDMLFYGAKVHQFADGVGYDVSRKMYDSFDQGGDTISKPLEMSYFGGWNKGVSYVYGVADRSASGELGKLLIPIFSGSITATFTHERRCSTRGAAGRACQNQRQIRFERFLTVGSGDVASALGPLYELQERPYGRVQGHVVDGNEARPVSDVNVFAIKKVQGTPCSESHWCQGLPATISSYDDLAQTNRCYTACASIADDPTPAAGFDLDGCDRACYSDPLCVGCTDATTQDACLEQQKNSCLNNDLEGNVGFESQMMTDIGLENTVHSGFYSGPLPVGEYYLVARKGVQAPSIPIPLTIREGKTQKIGLMLPPTGSLDIQVFGQDGSLLPAKATIGHCFAECSPTLNSTDGSNPDCAAGLTCDADENCRPVAGGSGEARCQPDEVSQGSVCLCDRASGGYPELGDPRFSPSEKTTKIKFMRDGVGHIDLPPGGYEVRITHGPEYTQHTEHVVIERNMTTRLISQLSQVVDTTGWVSGDFHIHGVDSYDASVSRKDRIRQMVSEDVQILSGSDHDFIIDHGVTTADMHERHRLKTQVGLELTTVEIAHWLVFPVDYDQTRPEGGAIDWTDKPPGQIHYEARKLGEFGDAMVAVSHPRDGFFGLFDQYGLNPFDLRVSPGFLQSVNGLLQPANWDTNFDAFEIFNAKRFEMIRTPSVREIGLINMVGKETAASSGLTVPELQEIYRKASNHVIRQVLVRTAEENLAWHDYAARLAAAREAVDDWDSKPNLLANCMWGDASVLPCRNHADCGAGERCDLWLGEVPDLDGTLRPIGNCAAICTDDGDCSLDGTTCRGAVPGTGERLCRERGDDPCTNIQGPLDDFFSMLNHLPPDRAPVALGHSDSHTLKKNEGGTPRNWVTSSTDIAPYIDRQEITRNMIDGHVTTGYGVFPELWVDGQPIGSIVEASAGESVAVRVRVQSPLWFDVDRVEVYRNGQLIREFSLSLPNQQVVNLDQTFNDSPAEDSWYAVVALGTMGKRMDPANISKPLISLTIGLITGRAFSNIEGLPIDAFLEPALLEPTVFGTYPFGVTNAVWVNLGGDDWTPPAGPPGWELQPDGPNRAARVPAVAGALQQRRARFNQILHSTGF